MAAKKRANRSRPAKRSKAARKATGKRRTAKPARKARRTAAKSSRPKRRAKPAKAAKRQIRAKARKIAAAPKPKARPSAKAPKLAPLAPSKAALLQRERRRLPDTERNEPPAVHADPRMIAAARAGREELKADLERHTSTSPKLTAGDLDAKWQDADSVGDEAPGGDNPTPDQDRVDDIGKALGVQYQDDQELEGGDEITSRDRHRWELDPASSDDWPHGEDK